MLAYESSGGATLHRLAALSDNYIWLLVNPSSGEVAVIDAGESKPVISYLTTHNLTLNVVVNTHHHHDHIGGNAELVALSAAPLIAPASEAARIEAITHPVQNGDVISIAGYEAHVIKTPGHTSGHIAFYLPNCFGDHGIAFVGDTLFSMGCGRVFEGEMHEMWQSMLALRALPDETIICCGHEYSAANARYVEKLGWLPDEARSRIATIHALVARDEATLPFRLGDEKRANPFLACDDAGLAACLRVDGGDAVAVFTALRQGKDSFRDPGR